jgi:glycerol-3-phosphate acyltransferase PlsY
MLLYLSWFIAAYIIGSIPASFIIAKAWKGIDIRQHGSGNPGATNVFRVAGPLPGIVAFIADFIKGLVPVLLALRFSGQSPVLVPMAVGLCAVIGHMFTVFLHFKGGKGVATGAGVFCALLPLPTLYAFILFWAVVWLTGYVSVGSILAAVFLALYCWLAAVPLPLALFSTGVGAIIIYKHRTNIRNLIAGKEHKFGRRKPPVTPGDNR